MHSKKQQIEAELKKKDADLQKREDEMMAGLREQFKELSMQREVCMCVRECNYMIISLEATSKNLWFHTFEVERVAH